MRIAHLHLAAARRALLQDDPRFVDVNRALVPRVNFLAEGLPFGATPEEIVDAVLKATGFACIRSADRASWCGSLPFSGVSRAGFHPLVCWPPL